jgi:hypothetical protein
MRILSKCGEPILSVDDWFAKAPPKQGARHWKDYRSAKELAKSWFRAPNPTPPEELLLFLLRAFPATDLALTDGYPERIIALDRFGGEQRNTDLLVVGSVGSQKVAISIEAKADEPFGDQLVGEYYDRRRTVPDSNLPARIDSLCQALFHTDLIPRVRSLRYQLLHATAAALIAARNHGAEIAVFLVHEFISDRLNPAKLARNEHDWKTFIDVLTEGLGIDIQPNGAIGPVRVVGGEHIPSHIPLYLGKIETALS